MANTPVTWGIVSTADINRKVIPGAKASDKVDLVGVASRTQERAERLREGVGDPARVRLVRGAARRPGDRSGLHLAAEHDALRWSIKAVEAGKHVLCEKPLSRHPGEVEAAFAAAERAERHLSEAFMYRHNPQTKKLTELVADGAIGELRLVRSTFSYSLYDEDNIRLQTDVEGGSLMDVGCYNVSGSRLLAGEPERVWGEAWYGPTGTDWVFTGTMRFPGDVIATFDCGTAMTNRDELEAIGSEGSLFVDDPWHCLKPVIELRRGDGSVERIEIAQRGLVPAGAREPERRDPRHGQAAAGPRRRAWPGTGARGAARVRDRERAGVAVTESEARERAAAMLEAGGIVLTAAERAQIEVADFGLGDLDETGLQIRGLRQHRSCVREGARALSRPDCPEHRHPPVGDDPGKEETFRCRTGSVELHVDGHEPVDAPARRAVHDHARHAALVPRG